RRRWESREGSASASSPCSDDTKRAHPAPAPGGARNRKLTSCRRGRSPGEEVPCTARSRPLTRPQPHRPRSDRNEPACVPPGNVICYEPRLTAADLEKEIARRRPK